MVPESEGVCDCLADHPSLQDLTLDQNDIGDLGALALSNALVSNKVLISLSLVHCHVCEGGARRILYSLETKNKTLRALVRSCGADVAFLLVGACARSRRTVLATRCPARHRTCPTTKCPKRCTAAFTLLCESGAALRRAPYSEARGLTVLK